MFEFQFFIQWYNFCYWTWVNNYAFQTSFILVISLIQPKLYRPHRDESKHCSVFTLSFLSIVRYSFCSALALWMMMIIIYFYILCMIIDNYYSWAWASGLGKSNTYLHSRSQKFSVFSLTSKPINTIETVCGWIYCTDTQQMIANGTKSIYALFNLLYYACVRASVRFFFSISSFVLLFVHFPNLFAMYIFAVVVLMTMHLVIQLNWRQKHMRLYQQLLFMLKPLPNRKYISYFFELSRSLSLSPKANRSSDRSKNVCNFFLRLDHHFFFIS